MMDMNDSIINEAIVSMFGAVFIIGEEWAGVVRLAAENKHGFRYHLTYQDGNGQEQSRRFFSIESLEQFMDELDMNGGIFNA